MPRKTVADEASYMALPEFVYRRGNRLHYRRAWPKDVWPLTGNTSFAKALRTTSRFQRLDGQDDGAMWEQGQIAVDGIVRELEAALAQAGLSDRLLRIDAGKVSARRAAAVIAGTLDLLEQRSGSDD